MISTLRDYRKTVERLAWGKEKENYETDPAYFDQAIPFWERELEEFERRIGGLIERVFQAADQIIVERNLEKQKEFERKNPL